jgi:hypothetical protein
MPEALLGSGEPGRRSRSQLADLRLRPVHLEVDAVDFHRPRLLPQRERLPVHGLQNVLEGPPALGALHENIDGSIFADGGAAPPYRRLQQLRPPLVPYHGLPDETDQQLRLRAAGGETGQECRPDPVPKLIYMSVRGVLGERPQGIEQIDPETVSLALHEIGHRSAGAARRSGAAGGEQDSDGCQA